MSTIVKSIATIDKSIIATRNEEREMDIKTADSVVKVRLDNIVVRKKFNRRSTFEEIHELADSIEATGLNIPLIVDILKTGEVVLTDGERRFHALIELSKRSPELKKRFEYIQVKKNDKDLTETERLLVMMSTQSSKHFDALDEADSYLELTQGYMGEPALTPTQIAIGVGKTLPYIDQRLTLARSSDKERELIRTGKTTPTAMQQLIRQESDPEIRVATVKEKNDQGKKFKVKDVKNTPVISLCEDVLLIFKKIDDKFDLSGELGNLLLDARAKVNAIKKTIQ